MGPSKGQKLKKIPDLEEKSGKILKINLKKIFLKMVKKFFGNKLAPNWLIVGIVEARSDPKTGSLHCPSLLDLSFVEFIRPVVADGFEFKTSFGSKVEKSNCARCEALGLGKVISEDFTYFQA